MWIAFAALSALFAGITSVLAKCGIKQTSSNTATAIRTIVVLIFSWIMVFIAGSHTQIDTVSKKSWIFLILSGIATGASWLCYFKALQSGDVNKVVPIDKSSTVLTILLFHNPARRNNDCKRHRYCSYCSGNFSYDSEKNHGRKQ